MGKVELGNHDVVKRNYDYLLLAKQNVFFKVAGTLKILQVVMIGLLLGG